MKHIVTVGQFLIILIAMNVLHTIIAPINILVLYSVKEIYQRKNIRYSAIFIALSSLIQDTIAVVPLMAFALSWILTVFPIYYLLRLTEELLKTLQPYVKIVINAAFFSAIMLLQSVMIKVIAGAGKTILVQHVIISIVFAIIIAYIIEKRKMNNQSFY